MEIICIQGKPGVGKTRLAEMLACELESARVINRDMEIVKKELAKNAKPASIDAYNNALKTILPYLQKSNIRIAIIESIIADKLDIWASSYQVVLEDKSSASSVFQNILKKFKNTSPKETEMV